MLLNIALTVNVTHDCGGKISLPADTVGDPYLCPTCNRHNPTPEEAEAPDEDFVAKRMASIAHSGIARSLH